VVVRRGMIMALSKLIWPKKGAKSTKIKFQSL
jgi:hypothetical protein